MNTITQPHEVERYALSVAAFEHLTKTLTERGNTLSGKHSVALLKMVELFAGYVAGEESGRVAYPLPTGMGKTTGVVSFIAAMHQLGYRVPVAVAASQVQALVTLKRDLVAAGVPPEDIGLAHRDPKAGEQSTGCRPEDGRLVQLVTHARVRMGDDYLGLFTQYQGQQRRLMVYDETLLRSDSFAFLANTLGAAAEAFARMARGKPEAAAVAEFLLLSTQAIDQTLEVARGGDPKGLPLELPEVHPEVLAVWTQAVSKVSLPRAFTEVLQGFLEVSQLPLRVLPMVQGGGAVAVRQAVSQQLGNVVILDASTPIRQLVSMDDSIKVYGPLPDDLKSFEEVEVMQLLAAGGRSSIEQSFTERAKETSTVSREVVDIIKDELAADPGRCSLVFCFRKSSRNDLDIKARLAADLLAAGIDPDEQVQTEDGPRPRVSFLTWGQHEGLNGYEFCKTVILAGVLHRAHLDIAASIKGQKLDLAAPTTHEMVSQVIKSEVAHCVYQAASRGSCRRVELGKAKPMRLWLIHMDLGLKDTISKVMPKAQWSYPEPRHIKRSTLGAVEATMRGHILEALRSIPEGTLKVSSRALKEAMKLPQDEGTRSAFSRAMASLDLSAHGWRTEGRSLVRGAAAYGFTSS